MVRVEDTSSVLFEGMAGSTLPVVVAHGEGRALFTDSAGLKAVSENRLVAMRFVDNHLNVTQRYPAIPNGSPEGVTALTSRDGRATIMMPHPERVFRGSQMSWHPPEWQQDSGWMRIFRNARRFLG